MDKVTHPQRTRKHDVRGDAVKTEIPVIGLGERYFEKLNKNREKILQVDASSGLTVTQGSVCNKSILIAMELYCKNITDRDRVVICSKTTMDLTPTVLGIWFTGAIVCPLDPNLPLEDCTSLLQKLQPKMVFTDKRSHGYVDLALKQSENAGCIQVIYGQMSSGDNVGTDTIYGRKVEEQYHPRRIERPRQKTALIMATEGATNLPKLVEISHYALLARCIPFMESVSSGTKRLERLLTFYPFGSLPNLTLLCWSIEEGLVRILPGVPFTEKYACRLIHDLRVDLAVFGTEQAMKLVDYLSTTQDFDLSCLKCLVAGLTATSAQQTIQLMAAFPRANIINTYGNAECGFITGILENQYNVVAEKTGTCGKVCPGIKLKIMDMLSGELQGPDKWGELYISAPGVMTGYYNDSQTSKTVLHTGYYKTGDIAQYDEDDWFYIQGRQIDYVTKEGISFPAVELEELISMNKFVKEVAIVGTGTDIIACVVVESKKKCTADDLKEYIADRISKEKRPDIIRFFDILPKSPNGKIQKFRLHKSTTTLEICKSSLTYIRH